MPKVDIRTQAARINEFQKGFMATHLINIGNETGIFEELKNAKKEGLTISELAMKLGLHEPYVKIWCNTANFFEILDCDTDGRFKFQPFLNVLLGNKSDMRNMLGFFNMNVNVWGKRFKTFPELYKTGKHVENYTDSYSPEVSSLIVQATKPIHFFLKNYIMQNSKCATIKQLLEQGTVFLDIGCGGGNFILQLAQMFSNSKFVGIDIVNHEIELARKRILELGLEKKISLECLNGQELQHDDEFGAISMIFSIHEMFPDDRLTILEKIYRALKKSGVLLIVDFEYPSKFEDFRNPNYERGILHQFQDIYLGTNLLSTLELNELLAKVGFHDFQRDNFRGISIISAVK